MFSEIFNFIRLTENTFRRNGRLSNTLNASAVGIIIGDAIELSKMPPTHGVISGPEIVGVGTLLLGALAFVLSIRTAKS